MTEKVIEYLLAAATTISVLSTFAIVAALLGDTISFFKTVSVLDFLTDREWTPLFADKKFGVLPLVCATLLTSSVALIFSLPLGLTISIYLSEYASPRTRFLIKSLLEILAGIPTVVYGFFALTTITPILQSIIPGVSTFNSLSAGIVMGIMILPIISSLCEDAMSAVPLSLREAAYGLGATRFEVAVRVVLPSAFSGVMAASVLALSRAVGETMIVAIAAGQNPTLTLDPRVPVETMTAYIVQVCLGDTPAGSLVYQTIFAVGTTLFLMTLVMNWLSQILVRRYREVYQ